MARYQVQPNKTIRHGNDRFIVRGVTMFDTIFCGFEIRDDYTFRQGSVDGSGVSQTTHYGPSVYGPGGSIMRHQLDEAYKAGVNFLRVCVEPAMLNATECTIEYDGAEYPPELEMLDTIIAEAAKRDMVVLLTSAQAMTTLEQDQHFWTVVATRYLDHENVWLNPLNEIGCWLSGPECYLAQPWAVAVAARLSTMRATGFKNPIVINPPGYGFDLATAVPALLGNPTFSNDPNLIIGIHQYYTGADFNATTANGAWAGFLGKFCIIIEEMGIDCYPGRYDPALEPWSPSLNLGQWEAMQRWARGLLSWAKDLPQLNGIVGTSWNWWQPGTPGVQDDNSMRRQDGSWTTWGCIFRDGWLSPPMSGQPAVILPLGSVGQAPPNRTYRICIPAALVSSFGSRCRLTFKGPTTGTAPMISAVWVGVGAHSSGDVYDFASSPAPVSFNGSGSVTLAVGGTVQSDIVSFPVAPGLPIVVAFVVNNACNILYGSIPGVFDVYKDTPDSGTLNASGYVHEGQMSVCLSGIEVFP